MNSDIYREKLIHKGAEANLYYGQWFNKKVIFKRRVPKRYRLEELDKRIRTERTLNEARALIRAKNYGVNIPQVYEIDVQNSTIVMKYIEGEKLKKILRTLDNNKKEEYFKKIGRDIAILHKNGHIHGDITTSNLIITQNEDIFIIDFGLHENSDKIEDKSVDLHLFKRVLISSHGKDYEVCFNAFIQGYISECEKENKNECNLIIKNINAIETRGRYVKSEDRL
ncbi:MAG: Kae1-associated serine/threonine protein kinase [Promethearchaeota archaeon]|nr:MAG: Kae1-associated serine/threonine protein kinase [Candidatus Lokiarchaeota archaeon]